MEATMFYENIKIINEDNEENNEEEVAGLDQRDEDFKREYEERAWKIDDHD